mmetsp:Transcript_23083/g.52512  ORF Transcript_23083/g.52512 Transcript_23083/m.52512 type:complete len:406 (+) Transcript_23083:812-2029(+)
MLKRVRRPGDVEASTVLPTPQVLLVVCGIQLAAQGKLQEQVQRLVTVVSLVQFDDELGVAHQLHVLFAHDAALHARLHDVALAKRLQGIGLAGLDVLDHLHRSEAAATQQAKALQLLAVDHAEAFLVELHLRLTLPHLRLTVLASLLQLLQWSEEHVERHLVHGECSDSLRGHCDGGRAGLVVEQGLLAEEWSLLLAASQFVHLLAVLDDADRALNQDVEVVALLTLLENLLVLAEHHLVQSLGQLDLLIILQRLEKFDLVEVLDVLFAGLHRRARQNALEGSAVDHPDNGWGLGRDRGGTRREVHQRELSETLPRTVLADGVHLLHRGGTLSNGYVELSLRDDVEVIGVEIALSDDLLPRRDGLLPHASDDLLDLRVIERDHGGQIRIALQCLAHHLLLCGSLR